MLVDAHSRGALVAPQDAAAVAFLLRLGIREATRTDGLRMPLSVSRFLDELDALAHEHAASMLSARASLLGEGKTSSAACQAEAASRDSRPDQAHDRRHAEQPS